MTWGLVGLAAPSGGAPVEAAPRGGPTHTTTNACQKNKKSRYCDAELSKHKALSLHLGAFAVETAIFFTASDAVGYLLSPAPRADFINELLTQDTSIIVHDNEHAHS
jgi:hypothetical protein